MRVPLHIWTDEEVTLLMNPAISVRELHEILNIRPGTIRKKRIELGITGNLSAIKTGRKCPNRVKNETRICINPACKKTFTVKPSMTKRCCSRSCNMTINNPRTGLGKGNGTIRNPNRDEYKRYAGLVHALTSKIYNENIDIINPDRHPRTLCGVDGGWQLDHITTIKECFENNVPAKEAAALDNLRMLPWRENLMRNFK